MVADVCELLKGKIQVAHSVEKTTSSYGVEVVLDHVLDGTVGEEGRDEAGDGEKHRHRIDQPINHRPPMKTTADSNERETSLSGESVGFPVLSRHGLIPTCRKPTEGALPRNEIDVLVPVPLWGSPSIHSTVIQLSFFI